MASENQIVQIDRFAILKVFALSYKDILYVYFSLLIHVWFYT